MPWSLFQMPMTYLLHQLEDTKNLAQTIAKELMGGEVLFLVGDLGSGKTTFVQYLAETLHSTSKVTSPTYSLVNRYTVSLGSIRTLIHADLYRLDHARDVVPLALNEDAHQPDTVLCIEWPKSEVIGQYLIPTMVLTFTVLDDHTRQVEVVNHPHR